MPRPIESEVVAAVYVRARVGGGLRYSSGESKRKWGALGQRLGAWCDSFEVFSPAERRRLRRRLGTWSDRDQINGVWRLEALGVLAWALSLKRTIQAWDRAKVAKRCGWIARVVSGDFSVSREALSRAYRRSVESRALDSSSASLTRGPDSS